MILGSLGKFGGNSVSDIDSWLVCTDVRITDLEFMIKASEEELKIRKTLNSSYNYLNLSRHRASIFSEQEAELYRRSFAVRVGIPYIIGEQNVLQGNNNSSRNIVFTEKEIKTDLLVSMDEFHNAYTVLDNDVIRKKATRRIIQEGRYYRVGERIKGNTEIDRLVDVEYDGDWQKAMETELEKTRMWVGEVEPKEYEKRALLHKLAWTLEKVRWEMIESKLDSRYLERWRKGEGTGYGFSPHQIGRLMAQSAEILAWMSSSSKNLGEELCELTRDNYDPARITDAHIALTHWITDQMKHIIDNTSDIESAGKSVTLPIEVDGKKAIRRIGLGALKRFVVSEKKALQLLQLSDLILDYDTVDGEWIDIADLGGGRLPISDLENYLSEYVSELKKIHNKQVSNFGRLGSEIVDQKYSDYLRRRINSVNIPRDIQDKINLLLSQNQELLDEAEPILCHMDPGPRNVILTTANEVRLVDFEHSSGCVPEWDIERVLLQLPIETRDKFERKYYCDEEPREKIRNITKIVMVITFAYGLHNEDPSLSDNYYNIVRSLLDADASEKEISIPTVEIENSVI